MPPSDLGVPPTFPVPRLERYADYRDWLKVLLQRLKRQHGPGAIRALAEGAGCSQGHLSNIAEKRRRLYSPYLEQLAAAVGLDEPRTRLLEGMVARVHARGTTAKQESYEAVSRQRDAIVGADSRVLPPGGGHSAQVVLRALAEAGLKSRDPDLLGRLLWPPAPTREVERLLDELPAAPPLRRGLSPTRPEDLPRVLEAIARARLALEVLPLGERLLRFSIGLLPDEGWPDDLVALVARHQKELDAWAATARARGGPLVAMHIDLQVAPLSASVPGSGAAKVDGALTVRKDSATSETEGGETPTLIDRVPPGQLPEVFAYDDYVAFVEDWLTEKQAAKARNRATWSRGRLAEKVGCHRSVISNMLNRARRLPPRHVDGMARALQLKGDSARDFALLYRYTLSRSPRERAEILRQRMKSPGFMAARPVRAATLAALADLTHLALFELARHPGFQADPAWIASALGCSPEAAAAALADLRTLKALKPDETGALVPSDVCVWVEAAPYKDLLRVTHRLLMENTISKVLKEPERTRSASQVLVVPRAALPEMVERFQALHQSIMELVESYQGLNAPSWSVQCFTLQLVRGSSPFSPAPLTEAQ